MEARPAPIGLLLTPFPSQSSTNLRAQFQHLFKSAPPSTGSATRLRDLMNQADVLGLAQHLSRYS
eukprot:1137322-Pelagomonas_calceolata.AAC.5